LFLSIDDWWTDNDIAASSFRYPQGADRSAAEFHDTQLHLKRL